MLRLFLRLEKFIERANKTQQNITDMAAQLSAMPCRHSPYLSVVYPMVKFDSLVLSADLSKWDKKQMPETEYR